MFLLKVNQIYHFRLTIPVELIPILNRREIRASLHILNRREIRASLHTASKRIAQPIASRLGRDCRYILTRLEMTPKDVLMKMDSDQLIRIIRDYIKRTIDHHVNDHIIKGHRLRDTLDSLDIMIAQVRHFINEGKHYRTMKSEIERICTEYELNLDMETEGKILAYHLCTADIQAMERAKKELLDEEPVAESPVPIDPLEPAKPEPPPSITLSELIAQYREHQDTSGNWREGGADRDANAKFNALLSYFKPDTPIGTITVEHMQAYVKLLKALPPSFSKLKMYRGVALHELDPKTLIKNHKKQLATNTLRDYVILTRQLFAYATDMDLIPKNPCPALLVPKKDGNARDRKKAYTLDQIKTIFDPDRFIPWVRYGSARNPGSFDSAKFWIPILALCTTGRLEEICGLRVKDIQNTDSGLNLRITPHQDRKIKNVNSDRVVPVTKLIANRLLRFAESLPQDSKLFPELTPAHGKLSHNFGKTWRRYVRNKAGITDPKIAPMHSFRHYVIDLLYKAKVNLEVIKAMDGRTCPWWRRKWWDVRQRPSGADSEGGLFAGDGKCAGWCAWAADRCAVGYC